MHLAHVAGHPILGDATYGGASAAGDGCAVAAGDGSRGGRMCLHAKELTIPLLGGETKTFVAPDPFVTPTDGGIEDTLVIL